MMYEQVRNKVLELIKINEDWKGLDPESCDYEVKHAVHETLHDILNNIPEEPDFSQCILSVQVLTIDHIRQRMLHKHGLTLDTSVLLEILNSARIIHHDMNDLRQAMEHACWQYISRYHNQSELSIRFIARDAMKATYAHNPPNDVFVELENALQSLHEQGQVITKEYATSVLNDIRDDHLKKDKINEQIVEYGFEPFGHDSIEMYELMNMLWWKSQQYGGAQKSYIKECVELIAEKGAGKASNEVRDEYSKNKKS